MPRNLPYIAGHFPYHALPLSVPKLPKRIKRMSKKQFAEIVNHQSYLKLDRQMQERQKEREECARSVHLCYFGKVLSSYVAIAYGLIATGVIH